MIQTNRIDANSSGLGGHSNELFEFTALGSTDDFLRALLTRLDGHSKLSKTAIKQDIEAWPHLILLYRMEHFLMLQALDKLDDTEPRWIADLRYPLLSLLDRRDHVRLDQKPAHLAMQSCIHFTLEQIHPLHCLPDLNQRLIGHEKALPAYFSQSSMDLRREADLVAHFGELGQAYLLELALVPQRVDQLPRSFVDALVGFLLGGSVDEGARHVALGDEEQALVESPGQVQIAVRVAILLEDGLENTLAKLD